MMSKLYALPLFLILLLASCHRDDPEPGTMKSRRTVIVYMVAENSLDKYTSGDLREILVAKDSIPLDCNLVVYLDDSDMPSIYTYSAMTGKSLWKTLPEQDSCDSLNFRNTLADIVQAFPAERYGLVMWSHGSGWVPSPRSKHPHRTIGIDNNSGKTHNTGTELEIPVMRRMLEQLGVHWDYIFFDACFMQCVEVDYELRNVCDKVLASPAEIPAEGAPYHLILKSMFEDEDAAEHIARIYHQANVGKTYDDWGSVIQGGLIISVSRSSEMDNLARTMKGFIPGLFSGKREYGMDGTQFYCYFNSWSNWKPEYYDLGSAMNLLLSSPSDYQALTRQLALTYPVSLQTPFWLSEFFSKSQGIITDPSHLAGVSIFLPHSKYDDQDYNNRLHDFQWYKAAGWDLTGW